MPPRRTGRTGQSSPSFWRAPRPATRRRYNPAGAPPRRDWIQISVTSLPGLAAVIALIFTSLAIRATGAQLEITRQGQITDRYNAAITNLGSPSVDVRLGGIYALQRIMQDSPRDQPTVVAVLCAFVRDHAKAAIARSARPAVSPHPPPAPSQPPTDIQAALTVVSTRDLANDGFATVVDFTRADLSGADLRDAELSGAHLSGADLANAQLQRADLAYAHLSGAHLPGAYLFGAFLTCAFLVDADFRNADLTDADLTGAIVRGANFTGAAGVITIVPRLPTSSPVIDRPLGHCQF
jgi:hypothetical protein